MGCECDFVFIIDSSQSIGNASFTSVKTFVAYFLRFYDVRPDRVRVGVIFFNRHVIANATIEIGRYSSAEELERRILATPYYTDVTNTAEALRAAKKMLDTAPWRGAKAFILFTDGRHDFGDDPIPVGQSIRAEGIEAACVGVPGINGMLKPIDVQELEGICGKDNVIVVRQVHDLPAIKSPLEKLLPCNPHDCPPVTTTTTTPSTTTTTTTPSTTPSTTTTTPSTTTSSTTTTTTPSTTTTTTPYMGCDCDFILVLESSYRLTCANFEVVKNFSATLVQQYPLYGDKEVRFGVVAFATLVFKTIRFDDYDYAHELAAMIMKLPCQPQASADTYQGLLGAENMFRMYPMRGARGIILISDGRHQRGLDPVPLAEKLRDNHIHMEVIGVPGRTPLSVPDIKELTDIAGDHNKFRPLSSIGGLDWRTVDWVEEHQPCNPTICPTSTTQSTTTTSTTTTTPSTTTSSTTTTTTPTTTTTTTTPTTTTTTPSTTTTTTTPTTTTTTPTTTTTTPTTTTTTTTPTTTTTTPTTTTTTSTTTTTTPTTTMTTTTPSTTTTTTTPSTTTTTNTPYTGCECDFVLVLETSHRLTCGNFEIVKQFSAALVQSYAFGERDVRFGAVAFGASAFDHILFDQYSSAAALAATIRRIPCQSAALANTESGLAGARDIFKLYVERGARAAILISDGRHQLGTDPVPMAQTLRDMGVETVVIGVPGLTPLSVPDLKELTDIAGDGDLFLPLRDIMSLTGSLRWLRGHVPCEHCLPTTTTSTTTTTTTPSTTTTTTPSTTTTTTTPSTTTTTGKSCDCDFLLMIDSSQSIKKIPFRLIRDFLAYTLLPDYAIGRSEVRIAAMTYNMVIRFQFDFEKYDTLVDVQVGLEQFLYEPEVTNTTMALLAARDLFDKESTPHRAKWIVIFTDGRHTIGPDPVPVAGKIRAHGISILSIGVPGINGFLKPEDVKELEGMAGTMDRVILVDNATHLDRYKDKMEEKLPCKPEDCPTSTSTYTSTTSTPTPSTSTTTESTTTTTESTTTTPTPSTTTTEATTTTPTPSTSTTATTSTTHYKPTTTTTTEATTTTTGPQCQCDIVAIIDDSESVIKDNYEAVKYYLASFVSAYTLGASSDVQFFVITFNDFVRQTIVPPDYHYGDVAELQTDIMRLIFYTGLTNTTSALIKAHELLDRYGRPSAQTGVLFFSDGRHTEPSPPPIPYAEKIRKDFDATIVAVGVPGVNGMLKPVDVSELNGITGDPDNVLVLTNITELAGITPTVEKLLPCSQCTHTTVRPPVSTTTTTEAATTTTTPAICYGEIVFLIETSERVGPMIQGLFSIAVQLTKSVGVGEGSDDNHVAVAHFSRDSKTGVFFNLDSHNTYDAVRDFLFAVKKEDVLGISDLNYGLEVTLSQVLKGPYVRENAKVFLVLIAEGFFDQAYGCCDDPTTTGVIPRVQALVDDAFAVQVNTSGKSYRDMLATVVGSAANVYDTAKFMPIADRIKRELQQCAGAHAPAGGDDGVTLPAADLAMAAAEAPRLIDAPSVRQSAFNS